MMRRKLFLFHITANSRPSMFALITASPDRTHRARAKGKPQILPDNGGQIRSDSQTATHKCMKCFDLQIDCQNFSFLIPICSDNIFHFVIFFLKSSVVPWNNCSSNYCQYFYFTSSNSSKIIVFSCALVSIKLTFVKQFLAFFSGFHWVWWCVGWLGLCLTPGLHFNDCIFKCKDLNGEIFTMRTSWICLFLTFPDLVLQGSLYCPMGRMYAFCCFPGCGALSPVCWWHS